MRSWPMHAVVCMAALLCGGAAAQTPDDAAERARQSLAALTTPVPEGAAPEAIAKQRAAEAAALVDAVERTGVPADVLRKIDVGVAAVLLGDDAGARDALVQAATGRRGCTLRWWGPLAQLARDPQRPAACIGPATRCLGAAAWPKLVDELVRAFEDAAAPVEARARAIAAAGALARHDLPQWGPVGPLVKALSDGLEPVRVAAERELERLLWLPEGTTPAELRRWWESARSQPPSSMWRERARDAVRRDQATAGKAEQELLALLPHLDVAGLARALGYGSDAVRLEAAKLLGSRPDPNRAALDPLTRRLASERSADVREAIITAIGARLQPTDTEVLQLLMTMAAEKIERHPSVRRAAVQALARTPVAPAAKPIVDALRADTSPLVREAAAEALTGFAGHVVVADVAKALSMDVEKAAAVRVAVARTLGKLGEAPNGDPEACKPLAAAAKADPDENVRWQAVFALGSVVCEGKEAVEAMLHALRPDEAPRVRKLAVGQLGKRQNPAEFDRIAERLVAALGDADADVAGAASDGLRRLGAPDAYRLWDFARKAEGEGQLEGAAELAEASLIVVRNGAREKPLSEADQLKARGWLVDLWQRAGKPARAVPHAQWMYQQQPTTDWARKIADLSVQAGKLTDGMVALREAAARFADQAEGLRDHGVELLFTRVAESEETIEVAAASALGELGELPAGTHWMSDYLRAGAEAARELALAAQADAAARTKLHARMAAAEGWELAGLAEACLRRLGAAPALLAQADAALRAIGAARCPAPDSDVPPADATPEIRRQHRTAWSNAWRRVKPVLTKEKPK